MQLITTFNGSEQHVVHLPNVGREGTSFRRIVRWWLTVRVTVLKEYQWQRWGALQTNARMTAGHGTYCM